jgi:hypothetical protein
MLPLSNICIAIKEWCFLCGPCKDIISRAHYILYLCGGGIEYLNCSPSSHKRRQKGNPVSNETVRYCSKFCGSWTRKWQLWLGPVASVRVNTDPSSRQGGCHILKSCKYLRIFTMNMKEKLLRVPDDGLISRQTGRLTVGRKITLNLFFFSFAIGILMMEAMRSSETSFLKRATWCNIPDDDILHSNLSSHKLKFRHRCHHHLFMVVMGFECFWDSESYAGGSVATGRATQAGPVEG